MKTIALKNTKGQWLELEEFQEDGYRIMADSFRDVLGDPLRDVTCLEIGFREGVEILAGDLHEGICHAVYNGVEYEFNDQDDLKIFGSVESINEALEQDLIVGACPGDV